MSSTEAAPDLPLLRGGEHLPTLCRWLARLLEQWDAWAAPRNPEWLGLPTGNPAFPAIGDFMRHAFTPLHRYSDQVLGAEPFDDSALDSRDWAALKSHAKACLARHAEACTATTGSDWARQIEFRTRSAGILKVGTADALTHAATHCVWHLGGVAHLLRAAGIEPPQRSDLIFMAMSPLRPPED